MFSQPGINFGNLANAVKYKPSSVLDVTIIWCAFSLLLVCDMLVVLFSEIDCLYTTDTKNKFHSWSSSRLFWFHCEVWCWLGTHHFYFARNYNDISHSSHNILLFFLVFSFFFWVCKFHFVLRCAVLRFWICSFQKLWQKGVWTRLSVITPYI